MQAMTESRSTKNFLVAVYVSAQAILYCVGPPAFIYYVPVIGWWHMAAEPFHEWAWR